MLRKTWDESTREEIEGREDAVVNNAAQYCSVVRTGIGNVRMVLGGEVDASRFYDPHSSVNHRILTAFQSGIANHGRKMPPSTGSS